ncbi:MAG TPA: IGHMBP2 family helicase, partial [Methanothermococcus okinawensis]|nr:IGHMBP2 family helicase [Methanothermococcus okinawensis]
TLFEKLIELYPSKSRILEIQYRMNEKLMEFPNREFYRGKIRAYEGVKNISLLDLGVKETSLEELWKYILDPREPLIFVDTSQHPEKWEKQRKGSTSRENPLEAEVVKKILEGLIKMDIPPESIGVITPYEDQRDLIDTLIGNYGVEVKTVDGYQGREKEVIILSLVRSNRDGELGFLTDMRRLNVSLTRAKRKLIVIGDCETLKIHPTYKRFIEFVERKGVLILLNKIK